MGRERFEAGGGRFGPLVESPNGRPGLADDGARWLSEQPVGVIAWDFLEAHPHRELGLAVHALSWAVGLVLIDNCDLGALHGPITAKPERTGLLVASPLRIEGATGCAVNPVVIV